MKEFRFWPELLDFRSQLIPVLLEAGFDWLSDYGAIDTLHDLYGLEVCGIRTKETAGEILAVMASTFPELRRRSVIYKEWHDHPWEVRISRDVRDPDD